MATYIKDDSLDNVQRSMEFLAGLQSQRKNRDLETAIALNRMGKNKEAEELLLSSQRGLLGNLFGKDAEGWKAEGIFKEPDAQFSEATDIQGGILASLLDPKSPNYNPDQYKYMTKQNQVPSGLAGLAQLKNNNVDPFAQAETADNLKSKIDNFKRQQADGTVTYNRNAEAFNKNNSQYKKSYEGNEVDQHQELIDDTLLAMDNARSDGERLKAYNKYYTTGKAISDHYGHHFEAQAPAFFGIGANKGNSKGVEVVDYYYGKPGATSTDLVQIPKYMLGDDAKIQSYIKQKYNRFYSDDKSLISKAGTDQGGYLNPLEETKKRGEDLVLNSALADQIQKQIDESGTGLFTRDSVKEQNFRKQINAEGLDITRDAITGKWKVIPLGSSTPASNGGYKHLNNFRVNK